MLLLLHLELSFLIPANCWSIIEARSALKSQWWEELWNRKHLSKFLKLSNNSSSVSEMGGTSNSRVNGNQVRALRSIIINEDFSYDSTSSASSSSLVPVREPDVRPSLFSRDRTELSLSDTVEFSCSPTDVSSTVASTPVSFFFLIQRWHLKYRVMLWGLHGPFHPEVCSWI